MKPSHETRALYLNNFADAYFGRPVFWPDGRLAHPGLDPLHQKWRAEMHDEWMLRLEAAKEWEEMYR